MRFDYISDIDERPASAKPQGKGNLKSTSLKQTYSKRQSITEIPQPTQQWENAEAGPSQLRQRRSDIYNLDNNNNG